MSRTLVIFSFTFVVMACGGRDADLETARYLLGQGTQSSALKALDILERMLEGQGEGLQGEPLLEVMELYAGAKAAQAGFRSVTILTRLLHKKDGEKVSTAFRKALAPSAGTIGANLTEQQHRYNILKDAIETLESVVGGVQVDADPVVADPPSPSGDYLEETTSDQMRRRVDLVMGNLFFLQSLFILIDVSGFNTEEFTKELCEEELGPKLDSLDEDIEGPDVLTVALYRARWFYSRAGLDDIRFSGNSSNHKLVDFIEEIQLRFDASTVPAIDGLFKASADEIDEICTYLEEGN